jgi:hypothetical protein
MNQTHGIESSCSIVVKFVLIVLVNECSGLQRVILLEDATETMLHEVVHCRLDVS